MIYFYNIITTIVYSILVIIGSILTGRQPKVSLYHLDQGLSGMTDKDFWIDNDVCYKWRSRDQIKKAHNSMVLDKKITRFLDTYEFTQISKQDKVYAATRLKDFMTDNNMTIL